MRVDLKFTAEEGEEGQDEDDVAQDTAEWGSFGFLFTLAALSFEEAKPRGYSEAEYSARDGLRLTDFIEHLRFVRGELHFDADYVRGRRPDDARHVCQDPVYRTRSTICGCESPETPSLRPGGVREIDRTS